ARPRPLFYCETTLAAEAILLHNFYYGCLRKAPFKLPALSLTTNPLAFLLIFCDELQEWNRPALGRVDRAETLFIETSEISVDDRQMSLTFVTGRGIFAEDFVARKRTALEKRLDVASLFSNGLQLSTETSKAYYLASRLSDQVMPRLLIEELERLARMAHADYVQTQLRRDPNRSPEFPTWESLPPSLQYSNIRQAATISDKLAQVGCYLAESADSPALAAFSPAELELMSAYEHELWTHERRQSGWTLGAQKDAARMLSPYLVPYEELPEDIKQLDRDTIMNIIPFVEKVGLHVYRKSPDA
ncbi:MAG: hypothetical protein LBH64_04765, partial [Coriobacteriales bacterium]|nr:hypothetical protein [Coriobacteriales bacterium]